MPPRFRRSPRLPRCDPSEHYDDPLDLDNPTVPKTQSSIPPLPLTVTGLSDEDDARRHLALKLDPEILFCPNCETYMGQQPYRWCPQCWDTLQLVGTPPRRKKVNVR